jgi:outer membrane protein OmpA-like peptidoglycan-associated protein
MHFGAGWSIALTVRVVLPVVFLLTPSLAAADGWLVAETPAAIAISDAHDGVFRPGVMPAVGLYADNGRIALGVRARAGVLRDGAAPGDNRADPGLGGLGTFGVAARLLAGPAWIELVGGGGLTGHDLVPSFEGGIGVSFPVGDIDIGPSLRYVRVVSRDSMAAFGSADLALAGVDIRFGKQRAPRRAAVRIEPSIVKAPVFVEPPVDRDVERIALRESSCENRAGTAGCPELESTEIVVVNDRIVLDDRVLFDLDRARVRTHGKHMIGKIVQLWQASPDWKHLTIEGHADERGSDGYNLELSQRRADRVRDVMVKLGADPLAITALGLGRSRPRAIGHTEAAHRHNRRVEFAIERVHATELAKGSP